MNVRSAEWASGNLAAGPLGSYTFEVQATIGHRLMRYTFARSTADGRSLTAARIEAPDTLRGTEVGIWEPQSGLCRVTTFIPTMRSPKPIEGDHIFECLPLTDISYVDLMRQVASAGLTRRRSPDSGRTVEYRAGRRSVIENFSPAYTTPLARAVILDGREVRRWKVLSFGSPADHYMPERIEVSRADTSGPTVFVRTTGVLEILGPPAADDLRVLLSAATMTLEQES